jgi:hypothetical protein
MSSPEPSTTAVANSTSGGGGAADCSPRQAAKLATSTVRKTGRGIKRRIPGILVSPIHAGIVFLASLDFIIRPWAASRDAERGMRFRGD